MSDKLQFVAFKVSRYNSNHKLKEPLNKLKRAYLSKPAERVEA